ncbi:hypothetical protein HC928_05405 [bacterium]|nr:hypothetical protein [bacterium]
MIFTLRLLYLALSRELPDIFWDPLALGAVLYFFVFVRLRMYQAYYIAPVNFVGILYLSYFSFQAFTGRIAKNVLYAKYIILGVSVCLGLLITIQSIQYSSFSILFRKTLVNNHVQLTQAIEQYAKSSDQEVITLFFPVEPTSRTYLGPSLEYSITVFAAYLEYKGIDLYYESSNLPSESEDFVATDSEKKIFRLVSPTKFQDNLCVPFAPFQCFYQSNPNQDDLIVILPGFSEPQEILGFKSNTETIFSYQNIDNFSALERILFRFSQPPDIGYGDKTTHFSLMDVYLFESP